MKNFFKLLGIITLAVIIGFSMTACDPEGDDGGDNNGGNNNGTQAAANVTVTNNDSYGSTITFSMVTSTGSVYTTSTSFGVGQSRTLLAPAGNYRIQVTTGFLSFYYPSSTGTTFMSGNVNLRFTGTALN
jgi:hypothetical protein